MILLFADSIIVLDLIFKMSKTFYSQEFQKEYKYKINEKKITTSITDETSSSDEDDFVSDSEYNFREKF